MTPDLFSHGLISAVIYRLDKKKSTKGPYVTKVDLEDKRSVAEADTTALMRMVRIVSGVFV